MQSLHPVTKPDTNLFNGTSDELYLSAFDKFYKYLAYFCYKMLGDRQHGEDIAIETYVKLWYRMQSNDRCKTEANAKAFLFVSAQRKCLNELRHLKVREKARKDIIYSSKVYEEAIVLNNLIRTDVLRRISEVMETFPPARKQIFIMAYIEGMKNEEIAVSLNLCVSTVKTQKYRCVLALKQNIRKEL